MEHGTDYSLFPCITTRIPGLGREYPLGFRSNLAYGEQLFKEASYLALPFYEVNLQNSMPLLPFLIQRAHR
jgi:hypothetical protein